MKSIAISSRKIEALLYGLFWLLAFSLPYFSKRNDSYLYSSRVIEQWMHLTGFLIIFLVNVYILVPRLLFKKKYGSYFSIIFLLIVLLTGFWIIQHSLFPPNGFPLPQAAFRNDIPQPVHKSLFMIVVDSFISCILIIGAGTASKLISKWLNEEKLRKDIEKEQLKTNLALLRHQVSPHFFMNTLNNIHALIDINTEDAKDAIIRLSTLMRYLLYDSARGSISLKKEIEFINSFISLMRLRFSDNVDIAVIVPDQIPDLQIPPMLFISFLENAFKHGVSYQSKSFVYFELQINANSLICVVRNSKHGLTESPDDDYSGIGLVNIKKSLNLLYQEQYSLSLFNKENEYEVNLTIPL